MKIATVFVFFLLVGCAAQPSMDELETQAFITGDWSAVEARERAIARRALRSGKHCPAGYVTYCDESFGGMRCSCLRRDSLSIVVTGR